MSTEPRPDNHTSREWLVVRLAVSRAVAGDERFHDEVPVASRYNPGMKYSLRSLMVVVTLVCVVLGGVMGRVEYLRRWAEFHEQEAERCKENAPSVFGNYNKEARASQLEEEFADEVVRHTLLGRRYRSAVYRPWVIVDTAFGDSP